MFNVGGGEIMVILLLALLVLGPDKLPKYARQAGQYMNEFRRMTSGFQEEFRSAMDLGGDQAGSPTSPSDALSRSSEGPRLAAAPELVEPGPDAATPSAPAEPPAPVPAPTPVDTDHASFAADITPAAGTGPELITPNRPGAQDEGGAGSSSAA